MAKTSRAPRDDDATMIGRQFALLTVVARGEPSRQGHARWVCDCVCGGRALVYGSDLRRGQTRSCGCLGRRPNLNGLKHGMSHTPTYASYNAAKQRCWYPKDPYYHCYGGRGIKFLYASFEDFLSDLGERPPGTTLERRDNHGHYEAGNCCWATNKEQANNRRGNRLISAFDRTQTVSMWAHEAGINYTTLLQRLNKGWAPEAALSRRVRQ